MEEFLKSQFCQVELAITGEGLYRFREHYRDLEVTKQEWLKKSKDEKQKHVAKVFRCPVRPVSIIQNYAPNHRSQHEEFSENTNLLTPNRETKTINFYFPFRLGTLCRHSASLVAHYVEESGEDSKF